MAGRQLTEASVGADGMPHKHRLLMLLDEFPSLGALTFFETGLAFVAGYGIKVMLICQSFSQLNKLYGRDNSIMDNCHIRVVMAPNDEQVAKRISDMLGQRTQSRLQTNFTGHRLSPWLSHVSMAQQETGRALLNPDELMQLDNNKLIILVAGFKPILSHKVKYYQDDNYKNKAGMPEPETTTPDAPVQLPHHWVGHVLTDSERSEVEMLVELALSGGEVEIEETDKEKRSKSQEIEVTDTKSEKNKQDKALNDDLDLYNGNEANEVVF